MIQLRPYQAQAVQALRAALGQYDRVLAVAPMGAGKTTIASVLIRTEGKLTKRQVIKRWNKILWLAHRTELIGQAYEDLTNLGVKCGVQCASYEDQHPEHVDHSARVQVGSVQTIASRGLDTNINLIIIDEAHRAMADQYQEICAQFPNAEILGLTATPCRLDGHGPGSFLHAYDHRCQAKRAL